MAPQRHQQRHQISQRTEARQSRRDKNKAKKRVRRAFYLSASGIIGGLIIISLFLPSTLSPRQADPIQNYTSTEIIPEGTDYSGYESIPPTFGPHWPTGADWGIHTEEIPEERQVANLAQGGILIQYNEADESLVNQLTGFAENQSDFPCYLIVAPYAGMAYKIAVTAWGTRDTLESFDEDRLQRFVDAFKGSGPEPVACTPK